MYGDLQRFDDDILQALGDTKGKEHKRPPPPPTESGLSLIHRRLCLLHQLID